MRINPAYKKIIEETMERYGIQDHRLEMGGKHAHLLFSHDGRSHKVTIPGSPSDSQRGLKNFACDLRRRIVGMGVLADSHGRAHASVQQLERLKIALGGMLWRVFRQTQLDFFQKNCVGQYFFCRHITGGVDVHADNPAAQVAGKVFQALKLLDGRMRSAVAIGQDAHADNPAAWGVERLERLVWLGLAEGDGQGRYRKMGGTRQ